jgi:hypothetical protein
MLKTCVGEGDPKFADNSIDCGPGNTRSPAYFAGWMLGEHPAQVSLAGLQAIQNPEDIYSQIDVVAFTLYAVRRPSAWQGSSFFGS